MNKSKILILTSVFIIMMMLIMIPIESHGNTVEIQANLTVRKEPSGLGSKFITADADEELIFDAGLTIGLVNTLVFLFHDGSDPVYSNDFEVEHKFPVEGYYLVTVIAVGTGGIMSQDTVEVFIENEPPECDIDLPEFAYEDEIVPIAAVNLNDSLSDIAKFNYQWIMGDGNTLSNESSHINYSWSQAGTYPVTLIVFDDQYAMNDTHAFINIINKDPIANYHTSLDILPDGLYHGLEDQEIRFNASNTVDTPTDLKNIDFFWNFDDRGVSRGMVVHHTYTQSGLYDVKLTVIDDDGVRDEVVKTIKIDNTPPSVDINQDIITINEGQTINLRADATDTKTDLNRLNYSWSNENEGWLNSFHYSDDGSYIESVIVQDPEGESAYDEVLVHVNNVAPEISVHTALVETLMDLVITGTRDSFVEFTLLQEDNPIFNSSISSEPRPPITQNFSLPFIFDLNHDWKIQMTLKPFNDTLYFPYYGANPAHLTFHFNDNSKLKLNHVFHHGNTVWTIDLQDYLYSMPITFFGNIFDPGADDLNAEFKFGNKLIKTIAYTSEGDFYTEIPFNLTINPKKSSDLVINACDDDGGCSSLCIQIIDHKKEFAIGNLAPKLVTYNSIELNENTPFTFYVNVSSSPDTQPLTYFWDFGDGNFSDEENPTYNYSNMGEYLVSVSVSNRHGLTITKGIHVIVNNLAPQGELKGIFIGQEDDEITLTADFFDSDVDKKELLYIWDFQDGSISTGKEITHAFAQSGVYPVHLLVLDNNGFCSEIFQDIHIEDAMPIIHGPFAFETTESSVLNMKVDIYDSVLDEIEYEYIWEHNNQIIQSRILSTCKNSGSYSANLNITNSTGHTFAYTNIEFDFIERSPIIIVPSHIIYGGPQEITIKAFAYDSLYDNDILSYKLYLEGNEIVDCEGNGNYIETTLTFEESGTFVGYVKVNDDSPTTYSKNFAINVIMDSDGDGLTDEYELIEESTPDDQLGPVESLYYLRNESNSANHDDSDGDMINDYYEIEIYGTDPNNNDTDGDGLYDGFDYHPSILTGEMVLGTDPLKPDTDGDWLNDGLEVFGWEITVNKPTGQETIYVNSDPLKLDTDNDNLTDLEEYNNNLDPRNPDTDGDGISDWKEMGYSATFDSDGDGLSDAFEIGTFNKKKILVKQPLNYLSNFTNVDNFFNADTFPIPRPDYYTVEGTLLETMDEDPNTYWGCGAEFIEDRLPSAHNKTILFGAFLPIEEEDATIEIDYYSTAGTGASKRSVLSIWKNVSSPGDSWYYNYLYTTGRQKIQLHITKDNYSDFVHETFETPWNITLYNVIPITILSGWNRDIFYEYSDPNLPPQLNFKWSSEIRIYEASVNYWTEEPKNISDPNNPDTDGDGLNDWEEYYGGDDGFKTDPWNNDTDSDFLIDSAESFSLDVGLVNRTKVVNGHKYRFGANIMDSIDANGNVPTGVAAIKNATLTVGLSAEEEMNVDMKVWVGGVLVAEEVDYYCKDGIFYVSYDISQNTTQFTGEWELEVYTTKESMLEEFTGSFNLLLNPNLADCDGDGLLDGGELSGMYKGWNTNPATSDSDGDGWNDNIEINTKNTNPLSKDTDSDGVNDPYDIDPLYNLMIEVYVKEGHAENARHTYNYLVVVKIDDDQQALATKAKQADKDPRDREKILYYVWSWSSGCWVPVKKTWTAYTTSQFYWKYYFDIPDNQKYTKLTFEYWIKGGVGADLKLTSIDYWYYMGTGTWPNRVTPTLYGSGGSGGWIKPEIKTVGMKRVNTIAIHEPATGHYPAKYSFEDQLPFDGNYNATYTFNQDSDAAHYLAYDSFENNEHGSIPDGWEVLEGATEETSVDVIQEVDGHSKVIRASRAAGDTGYRPAVKKWVDQDDFTVELWFRAGQTDSYWRPLVLWESGTNNHFNVYAGDGGKIKIDNYFSGSNHFTDLQDYNAYQWYHLRVYYKKGTGSNGIIKIWIDGVLRYESYNLGYTNNIGYIYVVSASAEDWDGNLWIDAVDFSWADGYQVNRNCYKFVNISDWEVQHQVGHSLDLIDELDGHSQVLEIYNANSGSFNHLSNNIPNKNFGTIEFWCRADYLDFYSELKLYESDVRALNFVMFSGRFKVYDGSYRPLLDANWNYFSSNANIWYHIMLEFDCSSDTYQIWIDGKQAYWDNGGTLDPYFNFENPASEINGLRINNAGNKGNRKFWLDAVDFSWSDGYYLNRNCYRFNSGGWDTLQGPKRTVDIVDEVDGHTQVLEIHNANSGKTSVLEKSFEDKTYGTIEFWVRADSPDFYSELNLYDSDDNTRAFVLALFASHWFRINDGNYRIIVNKNLNWMSCVANTWYHIKLHFDANSDTAQIWIDGNQVYWNHGGWADPNFQFEHEVSKVNNLKFKNAGGKGDCKFWLDAVDMSWYYGYYGGRSMQEQGGLAQGHYPSIERFNILILGVVNPIGPFMAGINIILIPVSLFLHTKLHSMLENEEIPQALGEDSWSGMAAEFYGMDRSEESVCEHVESMISKEEITGDEAMQILNLLLVNATGYSIHEYTKCDAAGEVEKLGLASDILEMVPFDAQSMQNGPTGDLPTDLATWMFQVFVTVIMFLALPIIATILLFASLVNFLANWGMKFLAAFTEAALQMLEAAIKIIILVLAYILLALEILTLTIGFLVMVGIFFLFSLMFQLNYAWSLWRIEITDPTNQNNDFLLEIYLEWIYIEIIDMELPYICQRTEKGHEITGYKKEPVLLGETYSMKTESEMPDLKNDGTEVPEFITEEQISAFIFGLGLSLTIFSILFGILGIISDLNEGWGKITLGIIILTAVLLAIGLILPLSLHQELITFDTTIVWAGMVCGILLSGLLMYCALKMKIHEFIDHKWLLALINIVVAVFGLIAVIFDIIWETTSVIQDVISLLLLCLLPFVLTSIVIGKTVKEKSNLRIASKLLMIIGIIGVVIQIFLLIVNFISWCIGTLFVIFTYLLVGLIFLM